ncbi:MAG: ribose 5-phosphate isomerase B [Acidimicrobiia bacterium]|nr:ribose 5-phosphate isomerase B [Acidimicrobiia bacterium]
MLAGVLDEPAPSGETRVSPSPDVGAERIAIGADHGGFNLKQDLVERLRDAGYAVDDVGTDGTEPCDYPDFAHAVARQVARGNSTWGIMIDGAGIGSAMVANKVPGVRAAACYDLSTARNSREHNRANVLTLGAGLTGPDLAWQIVQEWVATPWGGDRHLRRVALINEIEELYAWAER